MNIFVVLCSGGSKKEKDSFSKSDPPRVKGEMEFSDLPPIEDLHITVPHEKCLPLGIIKSVVDPLGKLPVQ